MQNNNSQITSTLINEIRYLLHTGKDKKSIVLELLKKNYPMNYVNKLVDYVIAQESSHNLAYSLLKKPVSSSPVASQASVQQSHVVSQQHEAKGFLVPLVFIIVFCAILGGSVLFLFRSQVPELKEIKYDLELSKTEFFSGSMIEFYRVIQSPQDTTKEFNIVYKVLDSNDNAALEWSENKQISGSDRSFVTKKIPWSVKSGEYSLLSEMTSSDGTSVKSPLANIRIVNTNPEPVVILQNTSKPAVNISPITPVNLSVNNSNQEQNATPKPPKIEPTPNNSSPEPFNFDDEIRRQQEYREQVLKTIDEAKVYASANPPDNQKAALICQNLSEVSLVDNCFQQLAKSSLNYAFCYEVKDFSKKDFCFITYVIDSKDFEKCEMITSVKTQESCRLLNPAYKNPNYQPPESSVVNKTENLTKQEINESVNKTAELIS